EHPERQGQEREQDLARASQHERGHERDEQDRVDRPVLVGALHETDGLERDDRGPRNLGVHRPELGDEAERTLAVPDIHGGMDVEQEAPPVADELAAELGRDVLEPDRPGRQVGLQPLEVLDEVVVDLGLEGSPRGLGYLWISVGWVGPGARALRADVAELLLGLAIWSLVLRDIEATLDGSD